MLKTAIVGNVSLYAEVFSNYKDLFDFIPMISISEQFNSRLSVNTLLPNINIGQVSMDNITNILSDFDSLIITSTISDSLDTIISELNKTKYDFRNNCPKIEYENIVRLSLDFKNFSDERFFLTFICQVLRRLRSYGYRINIQSNIPSYSNLLDCIEKYPCPDFTLMICTPIFGNLFFSIDSSDFESKIEEVVSKLRDICRAKVSYLI
jgi:hypothetical protein